MGEDLVDWDKLTFSMTETDFMYIAKTKMNDAWMPGEIRPYGNISISPAAGVINYGQGLFEGMKAYRTSKGRVVLFRPEENARRMQRGADRLKRCLLVPESIFIDAVEQCVQRNSRWIPPMEKGALYVRPLLNGSGLYWVLHQPEYTFMVYVTQLSPYFKGGMTCIKL